MLIVRPLIQLISVFYLISINLAYADGPVGEHVNDLQSHLSEYSDEVLWLIDQVESIVNRYEQGGVELAQPEMVVDHWEEVKFHSAIESNFIPLYASIWQGLFSVKTAVENEESIKEVRAKLANLEQIMWQSLGAVKLAAQYQEQGLLQKIKTREAITPTATLIEIKQRLDRVLAKYAEKLSDEAIKIVQEVYLNRFEGIEGVLIEQDAELVEDLEIDFNVRLPKAIQEGASVDEVRSVILTMQNKLNKARTSLKEAAQSKPKIF